MQKKIILSVLAVALLIGGGVLMWKQQENQASKEAKNEEIKTSTVSAGVSDWNTYRNEKLGIEFKYPENTEVIYSNQKESTEEGEATATIRIEENNQNRISINYFPDFSLENYQEHWQKLDALAQREGQDKVSLGESNIQNSNVQIRKFDYCSYTVAGVNCGLKLSQYIIPLKSNGYLVLKADVWQDPKENQILLLKIAENFSLISY